MLSQGKGNVLGDRHAVEQGGILEDISNADSLLGQLPLGEAGEVFAVEVGLARGGPDEADHCFQEHGLPATALADDGHGLAASDL